ncbi:shikimate kinase [Methylicorpusculum sp.]|uniref:shikimate kinase n=1 Tax=Methylicorpusculum sp. TaxID=2713644 RepID=UPI00271FC049|nr:shikimate kinase [Methylicorpusculum sp.]MDO8845482.1 shikimate kinase [Methylicorpusculum sp.]
MRVFLTGVGCVGKTTVGRMLSELLDVPFFDLDEEIEGFFGTSIEQLQSRFKTIHSYRDEAAKALVHLLKRPESRHSVIALPPSGLMGGYLRAVKISFGVIVALSDKPENILERIVFYDIDSKLIEKCLTSSEKRWYLREIKKDITYFRKTYDRAHLRMDISGLDPNQAALCVKQAIELFESQRKEHGKSEQKDGQKR